MAEDTEGSTDGAAEDEQPLSERFLDLFVFLPTGLAVTLVEELPHLAERGRERLGVRVDSARAVGKFAVTAGGHELKRRSAGLRKPSSSTSTGPAPKAGPKVPPPGTEGTAPGSGPPRLRSIPRPPATPPSADAAARPAPAPATPPVTRDAHVPAVGSLAIPGFDTLSASQVVQRLDGLTRTELVAVRAYETSTRGRRTILSRVDQLLDERS